METWTAITSRRNVRSFADRPIAPADLDQILEAGRRSPSSQNWQPWDFILVTERATDNEFHRAQFDLGQATMAMTLAAAGLGIGSCHAGVADLRLARQVLGFPEDRDWALLLSLGYPAGRRWHRSSPRHAGRSTTSSTAAGGRSGAVQGCELPGGEFQVQCLRGLLVAADLGRADQREYPG